MLDPRDKAKFAALFVSYNRWADLMAARQPPLPSNLRKAVESIDRYAQQSLKSLFRQNISAIEVKRRLAKLEIAASQVLEFFYLNNLE